MRKSGGKALEQEKKRQPEQEQDNAQDRKISSSLRENEKYLRKRLENCSDILIRPMRLGEQRKVDCLMVYIEVAVSNMMLDDSAIGKMINHSGLFPRNRSGSSFSTTVWESQM